LRDVPDYAPATLQPGYGLLLETGEGSMIIQSFGLFWRVDEINWFPGRGTKGTWRLLGRRRASGTLELADFTDQTGIYILYGNYGPYYVGLTRRRGLGRRLKDHLRDAHMGKWDRFSWFGFKPFKRATDEQGLRVLRALPELKSFPPSAIIGAC
jgi:hypothetical protein